MKFNDAMIIANELVDSILTHHFKNFRVCGSIRRKQPEINDIDIVVIPKPETDYSFGEESLEGCILRLDPDGKKIANSLSGSSSKRFMLGEKIKRFEHKRIIIDLYLADESTFETLCLIRTGSKEHNIRLTTLARGKGLKLFASGKGLCLVDSKDNVIRIVENTEDGILLNLLNHIPKPENRN